MRFVLSACLRRATQRWQAVAESWNGFWFTPRAPDMLGLIRILAGLMLVYTHAVWGLRLHDFFGPDGWLSAEAVGSLQADQTVLSFWWWVPAGSIVIVHTAALIVLASFTVGLFTPVTSVLSFLIVISYANRVPSALFGLDQINAMLTLYLAIGPSGQTFSVDRLWARHRAARRFDWAERALASLAPPKSSSANLAVRLIQVHLCVIYFFAGVSKLQGTAWWNGEAMWLAFANLEYQTTDMTWLAAYPWLVNLMTHVTVLWEISFCVLVWKPSLRPLMLFMAVVLHVGIGAFLGMWTFGLAMLIGCSAFLPEGFPAATIHWLLRRRPSSEALLPVQDTESVPASRKARALETAAVPDRWSPADSSELAPPGTEPERRTPRRIWRPMRSVPAEPRNGTRAAEPAAPCACDAGSPASVHSLHAAEVRKRQPTVLCIGKHTRTRKLLQKYLPRRGFWVMATSDPRKGLGLLEANPPDCLLVLGAAMAKRELEKLQGKLHRHAPPSSARVTVLATEQAPWASAMESTHTVRVLVEPISLREVRAEIESALEQRALADAQPAS